MYTQSTLVAALFRKIIHHRNYECINLWYSCPLHTATHSWCQKNSEYNIVPLLCSVRITPCQHAANKSTRYFRSNIPYSWSKASWRFWRGLGGDWQAVERLWRASQTCFRYHVRAARWPVDTLDDFQNHIVALTPAWFKDVGWVESFLGFTRDENILIFVETHQSTLHASTSPRLLPHLPRTLLCPVLKKYCVQKAGHIVLFMQTPIYKYALVNKHP